MDLITSAFIFKSNESFQLSNAMEQGMTLLGMGQRGREQRNFQMKLKRYTLLLLEIYFFESLSKRNLWLTKFAPFIDLYFKSHKLSSLVGGGLEWQNVKYMSYNMYQVFESPHSNACLGLTCATSGLSTPWISIHFLSFLQWNFIGTKQWNNA